jgi:hypothetical protein
MTASSTIMFAIIWTEPSSVISWDLGFGIWVLGFTLQFAS